MINREIIYERDIYKSYMKIPSILDASFDEKLICQRTFAGCIPVEKCYVNGLGQYWYDITGRQALDAYCRVNTIGRRFFETLILRICNQLEQLEWNLVDSRCLMMDPELIFVNSRGEDINFTLYPASTGSFWVELQQLMEYLLTKLNHEDTDAVQTAYQIYEITLSEGYSMAELKETILRGRIKQESDNDIVSSKSENWEKDTAAREMLYHAKEEIDVENKQVEETEWYDRIEEKISSLCKKAKSILCSKFGDGIVGQLERFSKKEEVPMVVYPEEKSEEVERELNPTVCLSVAAGQAKGILLYEGFEGYSDFELEETVCMIGKHPRARMCIEKDTISQFHAKIEYIDQTYYIEDLNSTNGTFVNDEILNYKERRKLIGGESIRFADVKYRFL